MRTRADIEQDMLSTCADARAPAAENDEISVRIDQQHLTHLLAEYQLPLQRPASG